METNLDSEPGNGHTAVSHASSMTRHSLPSLSGGMHWSQEN